VLESTLSSKGLPRQYTAALALALAYLFFARLVDNTYVLLVMTLIPIWATLGVSWNIFSGYSGLISFGHAAFFGLGAYTVAILFEFFGLTPWVGLLLAAVVGALSGLLIGWPTFRLRGVYFSLAMLAYPLAMLYVFEYLGLQELALPMKKENAWAYMQFSDPWIYIALATALLVGAVLCNIKLGRSRFGLSLLAIKQNELAAQACGIDPFGWKLFALAISGAMAAVAGALYAVLLVIVTPHSTFGMLVSAQALILTMFGGVGLVAGPVIGALTLIPLSEFLTGTIGAHLPGIQGVIYGLAIIAVILVAPQGLLTWIGQRMGKARARPAPGVRGPVPAFVASRSARPEPEGQQVCMRVESVSRHYGGLQAVSQVSFEVRQGEILGIIGPNGAGKTTLFNLLNGLVAVSSGRVFFDGREITGLKPFEVCRLGIARTFQVARPFTRLSVLDNVLVGSLASQSDNDTARQMALRALEQVGMTDLAFHSAGHLTAVQLRLLEVARALASQPRLVLLDEVLAGLGGTEVEQVLHVLQGLRDQGITLVIIEHTMHAMVRLADRLIVLDHGKVLKVGDPQAVTSDALVIEAYLGKKWVKHAAS
jgi:branched-chain amino acid transport system permease protein